MGRYGTVQIRTKVWLIHDPLASLTLTCITGVGEWVGTVAILITVLLRMEGRTSCLRIRVNLQPCGRPVANAYLTTFSVKNLP